MAFGADLIGRVESRTNNKQQKTNHQHHCIHHHYTQVGFDSALHF